MKRNTHDFRQICAKNPMVRREFEKCDSLQDRLRCIRRFSSVCTFVKGFVDSPDLLLLLSSTVDAAPSIKSNIAGSLWRTVTIGRATAGDYRKRVDTDDDLKRLMKQAICEGENCPIVLLPPGLDVFSWDRPETRQLRDGCLANMTDIFFKTMEQGMTMSPLVVDRGSATKCSVVKNASASMVECGPKFLYRERDAKGWLVEHLDRLGYHSLSAMIKAYANLIAQEHGITAEWIFESNNIVLIYYDQYTGIPSHIDNITYTTGGPIYAVGIGPVSSLFDMIPATVDDGIPVRLEVSELSAVRLEGESRFQWSHAIPFGFSGVKFTILFRLDMLENTRMKLDPFLQVHLPTATTTEDGVVIDEELVLAMNKKSTRTTGREATQQQHYGIKTNNATTTTTVPKTETKQRTKADAVKERFLHFWRSASKDTTLELMCSDEESRHITNPTDSVQMCEAMAEIIHSCQLLRKNKMHFIDAFGCIGSDALTASTVLGGGGGGGGFIVDVLCVQSITDEKDPGRYERLHHNTLAIKTPVPIITFPMDIKRFIGVYASTFGKSGGIILYMDPPWDSLPDITTFIDANVLRPWQSEGWKQPALVCLKVPSVLAGMERLLGDRLGGKYECTRNLHARNKYYFSFFVSCCSSSKKRINNNNK